MLTKPIINELEILLKKGKKIQLEYQQATHELKMINISSKKIEIKKEV